MKGRKKPTNELVNPRPGKDRGHKLYTMIPLTASRIQPLMRCCHACLCNIYFSKMFTVIMSSALPSTLWGKQRNCYSPPYFRWGNWYAVCKYTLWKWRSQDDSRVLEGTSGPFSTVPGSTVHTTGRSWFLTPLAKSGFHILPMQKCQF